METTMLNYVVDNFMATIELVDTECGLDHKDKEYHQAVDYLCKKIGYRIPDGEDIPEAEIRIPICQECINALSGKEWILFYCVECNSSQWLNRKYAKKEYPKDINLIAFRTCPKCYNDSDDGRIN